MPLVHTLMRSPVILVSSTAPSKPSTVQASPSVATLTTASTRQAKVSEAPTRPIRPQTLLIPPPLVGAATTTTLPTTRTSPKTVAPSSSTVSQSSRMLSAPTPPRPSLNRRPDPIVDRESLVGLSCARSSLGNLTPGLFPLTSHIKGQIAYRPVLQNK